MKPQKKWVDMIADFAKVEVFVPKTQDLILACELSRVEVLEVCKSIYEELDIVHGGHQWH